MKAKSQGNAAFSQYFDQLWDQPVLVSDFDSELMMLWQLIQEGKAGAT
jgi:hypothetical protein